MGVGQNSPHTYCIFTNRAHSSEGPHHAFAHTHSGYRHCGVSLYKKYNTDFCNFELLQSCTSLKYTTLVLSCQRFCLINECIWKYTGNMLYPIVALFSSAFSEMYGAGNTFKCFNQHISFKKINNNVKILLPIFYLNMQAQNIIGRNIIWFCFVGCMPPQM